MELTAAYLTLIEVPMLGAETLRKLIGLYGCPMKALLDSSPQDFNRIQRIPHNLYDNVVTARKKLHKNQKLAEKLNELGIRIIFETDNDYPQGLTNLKSPPFLLLVRGGIKYDYNKSVSIIGSRTASEKGAQIAHSSASYLAENGYTIISGYADGIDINAHKGALDANGQTIIVLPHGILNFALKKEIPSVERILEKGAIISEVFPTAPWQTAYAHSRNRIIIGMSKKIFIVETRGKGGSMNSFQLAHDMGKDIFTVEYSDYPESASGNKKLIVNGAIPISSKRDVKKII